MTEYIDSSANGPGVRYTYRVAALRGDTKSGWSNVAGANGSLLTFAIVHTAVVDNEEDEPDFAFSMVVNPAPKFLPTDIISAVSSNGLSILLAFDKSLDGSHLPPATAFTVTADGNPIPVSGVAVHTISDQVLVLSLLSLIGAGEVILVSYADPTPDDDPAALQDTSGNDVASFTNIHVPNNGSELAGSPKNLKATPLEPGSYRLDWTPRTGSGSVPITGYEYRLSTDNGGSWTGWTAIPNSASLSSYVIENLDVNATYVFQLRAIDTLNKKGALALTSLELPNPPASLTAVRSGLRGSVRLNWTAPTPVLGAFVTGYEYRQSNDGGATWSYWTAIPDSANLTTYGLGHLDINTVFTFELSAVNFNGSRSLRIRSNREGDDDPR